MTKLVLADLHRRHVRGLKPLDAATEAALAADLRPGAKAILSAVKHRRFDRRSEGQRIRTLLRFESVIWSSGVKSVAGVDEAGMSPLAGPVSAAAVIFAPGTRIRDIDDSKKLDAATRDRLAIEIKAKAIAWSVGFADVEEIDRINIYWAGLLAMRRAVEGLAARPRPADRPSCGPLFHDAIVPMTLFVRNVEALFARFATNADPLCWIIAYA